MNSVTEEIHCPVLIRGLQLPCCLDILVASSSGATVQSSRGCSSRGNSSPISKHREPTIAKVSIPFDRESKVCNMTAPKSTRASASLLPPELLQHILSNLSLPDVAAAAVTCRGWKEVALDILWSDVNLIDLLNVLAPTEVIGGGGVRGGLVSEYERPRLRLLFKSKFDNRPCSS